MRTRELSYEDYGISEKECVELLEKCQNVDGDTEKLLLQAAQESNPDIASELFYSLRHDVSFQRLDTAQGQLLVDVVDFYAYRRKALYIFKEKMQERDKEVKEELSRQGLTRRYYPIEDACKELQMGRPSLKKMAAQANALIEFGNFRRVNMLVLCQFLNQECRG